MIARVLTQEFIAKERLNVVLEAIDGLQEIQRTSTLTRLQQAALEALERAYMRTVKHRGAALTQQAIARPIAIAHAAMEARPCAH